MLACAFHGKLLAPSRNISGCVESDSSILAGRCLLFLLTDLIYCHRLSAAYEQSCSRSSSIAVWEILCVTGSTTYCLCKCSKLLSSVMTLILIKVFQLAFRELSRLNTLLMDCSLTELSMITL